MGSQRLIFPLTGQTVATVTADNTQQLTSSGYALGNPLGAHKSMTFIYRVSAIGLGDTWVLETRWYSGLSTSYTIVASSGDITATTSGWVELPLVSPFETANYAIPFPVVLVMRNTVDGGAPKTISYAAAVARGG